jgi:hypothetical protein
MALTMTNGNDLFYCSDEYRLFHFPKVTDANDSGRVLDASAHLLSRALVSQSATESWCIKYSATSSVKQTSFVCINYLRHPPSFVSVTLETILFFVYDFCLISQYSTVLIPGVFYYFGLVYFSQFVLRLCNNVNHLSFALSWISVTFE